MNAVVTVIGKDRTGIIYNISKILSENNANILDLSQTVMQDLFTMIMMVDISDITCDFTDLKDELDTVGAGLGLSVRIQQEAIFNAMHTI
ncbi:MAG: ACT domain-containing protein [Eubacteriaceae bacterium]|jgi:ACT domain-containing protein